MCAAVIQTLEAHTTLFGGSGAPVQSRRNRRVDRPGRKARCPNSSDRSGSRQQTYLSGTAKPAISHRSAKAGTDQHRSRSLRSPGLVLPSQPVRLAFRALHAEDRKLHGVALEYLDSVLPRALREQLASYFETSLAAPKEVHQEEHLTKLLELNPSIIHKLERQGPAERGEGSKKEGTTAGL